MEFEEVYSEEDEELFQPTTNEESYLENIADTKYKKWINSDTDISNISSIYRLELENSNGKKPEFLIKGEKERKRDEYENNKGIEAKEYDDKNIEEDDSFGEEIKEINDEEIISKETNNINKNYTFIWSEGGNDVKITGSFSDWKIKFQMTKDPNDKIFKCKIPLGNDIYQYKFIVDGEWKFSKNFPTKDDGNGNINNILDNTKNELIQPKEKKNDHNNIIKNLKVKKNEYKKKTKNKQSRISTQTKTTKTRASTVNKEKNTRKNSIYESEYPSDDDILPLPLPNKRYYASFKLENYTNQKAIGNIKYYDYYDRYCFSDETSSRPIFILGHINLNHLISVKHNKSNLLKNSMSFRYREKASTFIYYK